MSLFASATYDRNALLSQAGRARARGRRKKAIDLAHQKLWGTPIQLMGLRRSENQKPLG